jgi:hypothetical protein
VLWHAVLRPQPRNDFACIVRWLCPFPTSVRPLASQALPGFAVPEDDEALRFHSAIMANGERSKLSLRRNPKLPLDERMRDDERPPPRTLTTLPRTTSSHPMPFTEQGPYVLSRKSAFDVCGGRLGQGMQLIPCHVTLVTAFAVLAGCIHWRWEPPAAPPLTPPPRSFSHTRLFTRSRALSLFFSLPHSHSLFRTAPCAHPSHTCPFPYRYKDGLGARITPGLRAVGPDGEPMQPPPRVKRRPRLAEEVRDQGPVAVPQDVVHNRLHNRPGLCACTRHSLAQLHG